MYSTLATSTYIGVLYRPVRTSVQAEASDTYEDLSLVDGLNLFAGGGKNMCNFKILV
jgi:hypothetical protein